LWKELTEWHREIYGDPAIGGANPENYFDRHLAMVGPEQLWVATKDHIVIGLVGLMYKENEAEIEPLVVKETYRRRGVGTKLVETAISEARSKGVRMLNVKPVARNIQAIRFFHRMGFGNLGFVELFMDFSNGSWKNGPEIYGLKFSY